MTQYRVSHSTNAAQTKGNTMNNKNVTNLNNVYNTKLGEEKAMKITLEQVLNSNYVTEDMIMKKEEVVDSNNEAEVVMDLKQKAALMEQLEKETSKTRKAVQAEIKLMEALKKAKLSGERDAAIAKLAAKVAEKTVKAVKAVEKGTVIGTGYTMQYTGVALKVTSEQGVKAGSWMEQKGKEWANSYNDKMIAEARAMAAEAAANKKK